MLAPEQAFPGPEISTPRIDPSSPVEKAGAHQRVRKQMLNYSLLISSAGYTMDGPVAAMLCQC